MKSFYNRKGFTMIELVIVIAIMGIVFTAVSSFLITNLKTFYRADDQIGAQYNAQIAMNEIVDNIMEAEGIQSIDKDEDTVKKIIFRINGSSFIQYDFNESSGTLNSGKGLSDTSITTSQYAENIKDFQVIKIVEDSDILGVEIIIKTELNDSEITLKNQVYFRNAGN